MLLNLPREGASNRGSELPGNSDVDGQLVLALRKMMKKEVELMVISAVEKLIVPMIESLIRKVVREEIQSASMALCNRKHEVTMSTESRTLQLKFLDEVSCPVLTGKKIEGKGGTYMRLAVVDSTTGQIVNIGSEASAKVEILLLQAEEDDGNQNWGTEDFNKRIISESDEEKPHVAKGMYVFLKEGVGFLSDVKLGHGQRWKKRCSCRLGARFVDCSPGTRVKEAWTDSFMIEDRRGKLYGKHHPPSLSDDIWRLIKIGKNGKRCKRLYEENIKIVQDFLFLLSVDPRKLKRVFGDSKEWKATVDHARTCKIDDKKIYLYRSPKFNFDVAFDVVARLMGIVRDSHYVQLDNLSEVEQAGARELLLLAFENRKGIRSVDDETSLIQAFPYESHDICVATDSERNDAYAPIESDTSSPKIGPSNNFSLIGSEIWDPYFSVSDQGSSSSPIASGSTQDLCGPFFTVPHQCPSPLPTARGYDQASCEPSLAVSHQGPSSSLLPLGSNQALCDPYFINPYQGPSSSPIALGSNHGLGGPSMTIPHQGPSSSPISLGSNQEVCDPSLIVSYLGTSYSLMPRSSAEALCDPPWIVPDLDPLFSPKDLGLHQALRYPSWTPPNQGPTYPLNDPISNQALCDPSFRVPDQASLVALGSYQDLRDPFFTVPDQGTSSSVIGLGSYQALGDPSLTDPEHASSDHFTDLDDFIRGNELFSLVYRHNNNHSETYAQPCSVQQSNSGRIRSFVAVAVGLRMWASRVRKRVTSISNIHVSKRPRVG